MGTGISFIDKSYDKISNTLQDARDDTVGFVQDTAEQVDKAANALVDLGSAIYDLVVDMPIDATEDLLHGDITEAIQTVNQSFSDFHQASLDVMDALSYDMFTDVTNYIRDTELGLKLTIDAAATGDINAIVALAIIATTIYVGAPIIAEGFAGAAAGFAGWDAMMVGYLAVQVAIVAGTVVMPLNTLGMTYREMQNIALKSAKQQAQDQEAWLNNMYTGQIGMWMAGGVLYNSIYAGGEMFNTSGSLKQTVFIGKKNENMTKELALSLGSHHDYAQKSLGVENIGTDSFSVLSVAKISTIK